MGNLKPLILRSKTNLKLISFSSLYVQKPKIKKIFIFLGFQINKRRNDKITYFYVFKKEKIFFHNQKKKFKKKLLEIKDNKKRRRLIKIILGVLFFLNDFPQKKL